MRPMIRRPVRSVASAASLCAAAVLGAVAPLAIAFPLAAQEVRVVQREFPRPDSITERVMRADVAEVQRMVASWREREAQLLRELRAAPPDDLAARRRLAEELGRLNRDGFAMLSAIEFRCLDEATPRPAGYLGINIDTRFSVSGHMVRTERNVVTSVEPGSPAEAAGVRAGDRLLAIAGRDARETLPELGDLLVPGRVVVVRVEREEGPRELSVTVGRRPEGFGRSCGEFEGLLQPLRAAAQGRFFVERPEIERRILVESQRAQQSGRARAADPATTPGVEFRIFSYGPGGEAGSATAFFAGAEFRALDDGWREALGVKQGVLVNAVATGSVAAQAGLRSGDVVVAVDRRPATSPIVLVQLLGSSGRAEAELEVVRARKKEMVTLRWAPR
jgi:C-terminal processing protease CtpA/Prc